MDEEHLTFLFLPLKKLLKCKFNEKDICKKILFM